MSSVWDTSPSVLAEEPSSMQGVRGGPLKVPQWQAEPASPHSPLPSGPQWGEEGCSASEMLPFEGMAGF